MHVNLISSKYISKTFFSHFLCGAITLSLMANSLGQL